MGNNQTNNEVRDLDIIFAYFNKSCKDALISPFDTDEYGNRKIILDSLYHFLVDYRGFNKFPKIVTDIKYEELDEPEIYHGFKAFDHGASLLTDFNYHYGYGYINGIFFTDKENISLRYTRQKGEIPMDMDRILRVKLLSDNHMDFDELEQIKLSPPNDLPENTSPQIKQKIIELYDFFRELESRGINSDDFREYMLKMSTFAVYLGLDYLTEKNYGHSIVYNRGIIAASEDEFYRFCENSEHYTNGVFDFYNHNPETDSYVSLAKYKKNNPERE